MVREHEIARTSFMRIVRQELIVPDGSTMEREIVLHPDAVTVIPFVDGDVILIRQFRAPAGAWLLEAPAGKLDHPDEDPLEAAVRECEEEVGYRPGELEWLTSYYTAPGFTDEYMHVYLASDLHPVPTRPDGPEERLAEIVRLPLDEAATRAANGEIRDGKTIIGLRLTAQRMYSPPA